MTNTVKLKIFALMLIVFSTLRTTPLFAPEGSCAGTAKACKEISNETCTVQEGCFQNQGLNQCAGTPLACLLIGNKRVCDRQTGCAWSR
jgi:hypothetical protein